MDNRHELRLAPKIDTLNNKEEYIYKLSIDPHFRFAELFCDRGLVVKRDNFLHITPTSIKKSGYDTVNLRIILFGESNRVLFYKYLIVKIEPKVYAKAIIKQTEAISYNNLSLERNMTYSKTNFRDKGAFSFETLDKLPVKDRKVLSITLSMVNKGYNRSFYIKGDQLTKDVITEIKKLKLPTQTYVRLDVRVGSKVRSIWTRFTMNG